MVVSRQPLLFPDHFKLFILWEYQQLLIVFYYFSSFGKSQNHRRLQIQIKQLLQLLIQQWNLNLFLYLILVGLFGIPNSINYIQIPIRRGIHLFHHSIQNLMYNCIYLQEILHLIMDQKYITFHNVYSYYSKLHFANKHIQNHLN